MEKRNIKYNLLKAQREFLEIPHDYNIDIACYQGGYGSGKTFCGSLLGILLCLYPIPLTVSIFEPKSPSLRLRFTICTSIARSEISKPSSPRKY